jgi:hypothetical protein
MPRRAYGAIESAFEAATIRLPIAELKPLKEVSEQIRLSAKYRQIAASMADVGIIEPPVVARDRSSPGAFLLLDGHLRVDVLKQLGQIEVDCLVATDDEAFTYNKRVNRIAIIQEHRMILKALKDGASEERVAAALNVNVGQIQRKRRLLEGISPEVAELLKDRHISIHTFWQLKKLAPLRQIEVAEIMIAMNKFSTSYAKSLVLATPQAQLADPGRPKATRGVSREQVAVMERESANLEREFRIAEQAYGTDHLDLVLAKGYLTRLLENPRVARYLQQNQPDIAGELRKIADLEVSSV